MDAGNVGSRFVSITLVAASLAIPAVAQEVRTDYARDTDFAQYHSFSILKLHASNTIVENRLRTDIVQALSQRGMREVPQGGDVAVTAIGSVTNQQEYTTFYNDMGSGWGYGGFGGWRGWGGWGGRGGGMGTSSTSTYTFPVGTLAIDLYDGRTHQLVFRGTAVDRLSSKSDKNAKKIVKAVDKIFDKLPGAKKVG